MDSRADLALFISPDALENRFMAVMTDEIVPMLDSVLPAVLCALEEARYDLLRARPNHRAEDSLPRMLF
jgi:hypothetical protein